METREITVYTEVMGSHLKLGTLDLPEDTCDIMEAEGIGLILTPVIRVLGEEWSHDAQQTYVHVEMVGLEATFEPATPAQDPPF